MRRILHSALTAMACMVFALVMCAAFTTYSHATTTLTNGSIIDPAEVNSASEGIDYYTENIVNQRVTLTYTVNMPASGTLFITTPTEQDLVQFVHITGTGAQYANEVTSGATKIKSYTISTPGPVSLELTVDTKTAGLSGAIGFSVRYAPSGGKKISANASDYRELILGAPAYNGTSTFSVKVPGNGYLEIDAKDEFGSYAVSLKTSGFKDYERISSTQAGTYIGVKKGTYKFTVKGASTYFIKAKFHKVKESSAKTSKSKAASLKKKKAQKGLVITNKKKVHWYKIKNPKNQKLKLAINGKKMSPGNNSIYSGYLNITVYFPDKSKRSAKLYPGISDEFSITYGTIGTSKARKGTYRIKVESVGGANGYYTIKWK